VAQWIAARLEPYGAYLAWRQALAARGEEFGWPAALRRLAPLLARP
jgi:hypothetical protein